MNFQLCKCNFFKHRNRRPVKEMLKNKKNEGKEQKKKRPKNIQGFHLRFYDVTHPIHAKILVICYSF